jgi:GDP-4-dehydro-6-deoxy-D-mannose reductase
MSHRALITGIAGFAGGYLAGELLARGDAVLGCSWDGKWEAFSEPALAGRVELVPWDLGDEAGLGERSRRRILDFQPDRIYHLAALSVPADSGQRQPTAKAWAINVEGTRRMLELAAGIAPAPRVLVVSSSKVYEHGATASRKLDEHAPLAPATAYGKTKLAAEQEARRAVRRGVHVVIARAFQHTGPRQNLPMMLPQWARQVAAGGGDAPIEVQTCDASIDLSDVRDVVRAYRLLPEKGSTGEAYNIGSGTPRRTGDVLRLLLEAAGMSGRAVLERNPGRKFDPIADVGRLRGLTGWRPEIALETTVADTLAWWRELMRKGEASQGA